MPSKDDAVKELVEHHFAVEPDLRAVYRIVGDREQAPDEPIKLLEVNAATVPTGSVEVFTFSPSAEVPYRVQIAEITPEELEQFRGDPTAVPRGWDLARVELFARPDAAE